MAAKPKRQIVERKLGREQARGICHGDGVVEIDPRLTGIERLEVVVHELIHRHQPYLDESEVEKLGLEIATDLWEHGWRQVRP